MTRRILIPGLMLLGLASGCADSAPSAPPAEQGALTTATAEPVAVIEEAAVTSDAPEEQTQATGEMPAEAKEHTEAGAEAFVEYYIETLGQVHTSKASLEDLRSLGAGSCKTCAAFEDAAERTPFGHEYLTLKECSATILGDEARVPATVVQVADGKQVDVVFHLVRDGDGWLLSELQLSA